MDLDNPDTPEDESELIQENHYYPFGMDQLGNWVATVGPKNDYLYNGKEWNEEIGWYDYGARWYDPAIGRFTTIDPLSELFFPINPYVYTGGNPISNVDPTGMAFWKSEWLNENVGYWTDNVGINSASSSANENHEKEEEGSSGNGNSAVTASSVVASSGSDDPCPNCPDPELKKLALMMALHRGGNAQDYYDIMANPDYVDNKVKANKKELIKLGSIALPVVRIAKLFGWGAAKGVKFPGTNPAKAPKGFEWKGKPGSTPGSKDGNWYNPKTGESLRPDLNHPDPIGPHWDYKDPSGNWWRIFPDGSNVPK